MWPDAARRHLKQRVIVTMAGELAALMLAPRAGRYLPPLRERAVSMVGGLPTAPVEVVAALRTELNRPGDSDAEKVMRYSWLAHGSGYAAGGTWLFL